VALAALAVGAAAGWFAGRASTPNVPDAKVSVPRASEQSTRMSGVGAHRPAANVVDKPRHAAVKVNADERREAGTAKQEEKPAQVAQPELQKDDNPFPRYLDMFKNNPEALTAEFQKEAEANRTRQAKMREDAVAKLNLNAEQAAVFEKALDDLVAAVTQLEQEQVDLVLSGKLNMDTASDGSLWNSNPLWSKRTTAAREGAVQETAERLYEQLEFSGISDADAQNIIYRAAYNTSFSYECLEPNLAVYDKVYKNMGVGNGIFSWCSRGRRQGGK
jgi:hypothetical protein